MKLFANYEQQIIYCTVKNDQTTVQVNLFIVINTVPVYIYQSVLAKAVLLQSIVC